MLNRSLGVLLAALATASCGLYTNVPAVVHVSEIKPATVQYDAPDSAGNRQIHDDPGSVTLIGEPGSIGVSYETASITYLTYQMKPTDSTVLPTLNLRMSVRVDSSNYPIDPKAGPIDQTKVGVLVNAGHNTVVLPVINRYVEQYGLNTSTNSPAITAEVTLGGFDDAGFPASLVVRVPISFTGAPGTGK